MLLAAVLASAGAVAAARHHPDMDLRAPGRPSLARALGAQAAGSLAAFGAAGYAGGASAYALSLAAGAVLGALANRARRAAAPGELAPALGLAAGAAWAVAPLPGRSHA